MTLTLVDCMMLSAALITPIAPMLYTMFINMLEVLDSWFKGDPNE